MNNPAENTRLSTALILSVMVVVLLGLDVFQIGKVGIGVMKGNGYLALMPATVATLPVIYALFRLQRQFPGQTVIDYAPRIIGRIPALLANLGFLIFSFLYKFGIGRDILSMTSTYQLDRTPL